MCAGLLAMVCYSQRGVGCLAVKVPDRLGRCGGDGRVPDADKARLGERIDLDGAGLRAIGVDAGGYEHGVVEVLAQIRQLRLETTRGTTNP